MQDFNARYFIAFWNIFAMFRRIFFKNRRKKAFPEGNINAKFRMQNAK